MFKSMCTICIIWSLKVWFMDNKINGSFLISKRNVFLWRLLQTLFMGICFSQTLLGTKLWQIAHPVNVLWMCASFSLWSLYLSSSNVLSLKQSLPQKVKSQATKLNQLNWSGLGQNQDSHGNDPSIKTPESFACHQTRSRTFKTMGTTRENTTNNLQKKYLARHVS